MASSFGDGSGLAPCELTEYEGIQVVDLGGSVASVVASVIATSAAA